MPPKKKKSGGGGGKKKKVDKKPALVIPIDDKLPALCDTKGSVLTDTISSSDTHSLSRLIAHYDYGKALVSTDINGSTPVHIAVKLNDPKMLQLLLSYNKINVNALEVMSIGGYSALHHACLGGHLNLIEMLLKCGASPNIKSNSTMGETSLQLCCKLGYIDCAKCLIKAGAHSETRDNFGNNASFWASNHRQEALMHALNLPPARSPTADEFLALLLKHNPKFELPRIKIKVKVKKEKDGKK